MKTETTYTLTCARCGKEQKYDHNEGSHRPDLRPYDWEWAWCYPPTQVDVVRPRYEEVCHDCLTVEERESLASSADDLPF